MRFFTMLGLEYSSTERDNSSHVYGPFEDDAAVERYISEHWPNDNTVKFLVTEGKIVGVKPSPLEKPEAEKRKAGNFDNYRPDGSGYRCKDCNAVLMAVSVAHSIHFKDMHGAGGGDVQREEVPYCPNCELKPSPYGTPIEV